MPTVPSSGDILSSSDLTSAPDNKARFGGWAAEPTKRKMRRAVSTNEVSGPPKVVRTGLTAARSPPYEERREAARSRRVTRGSNDSEPQPRKARTSKHWHESLMVATSGLADEKERAARRNAVSLWQLRSVGAVSLHNADLMERLEAQLQAMLAMIRPSVTMAAVPLPTAVVMRRPSWLPWQRTSASRTTCRWGGFTGRTRVNSADRASFAS
jgi:hypothetical protein